MSDDRAPIPDEPTDGSTTHITEQQEEYMEDLPDGTQAGLVDDSEDSDDSEVSSGKKS